MSDTPTQDLGITTGGDTVGHVLHLGTNEGGDFTPDGIAAAVEKLSTQIKVVDGEIDAMVAVQDFPDTQFLSDWSAFVIAWSDWKTDHSSWLSDAWNSTRDQLLDQRTQYEALRNRWAAIQPQTKSVTFTVQDAPKNTIEDWGNQIGAALKHIAIGAAWVVVAGAAAVIVWKLK